MDQLIPGLAALVEAFRDGFHPQVFQTFQALIAGWIVCLSRRTLSEVWQATGLAAQRHHDTAYAVFHSAAWEWDDLGIVLATLILSHLVPGSSVWIVVDDTLCHKRGTKVAFGGIFLDAVLSSRTHKIFRFGVHWVTLGGVVQFPLRKDRFFCVNLLWRVYSKKTKGLPHQTKSQLARQMLDLVATWLPDSVVYVVADSAYMGKHLIKGLPEHVHAIGPIHPKANLTHP